MSIGLPISSIEGRYINLLNGVRLQAPDIDAESVRIRAGNVVRLYPTCFAKQMFCFVGIKYVSCKVVGSL